MCWGFCARRLCPRNVSIFQTLLLHCLDAAGNSIFFLVCLKQWFDFGLQCLYLCFCEWLGICDADTTSLFDEFVETPRRDIGPANSPVFYAAFYGGKETVEIFSLLR